ncbi:cupin domain-containing protein [Mesorhizobium sp. KR9-304]|uniref:cupin domain-containing protein n=1 Tax=Mesorhizobium sp. KR9-304 TaxID=3156614 RepID=UPI0032B390F0
MSRCGDIYENRVTGEYAIVLRGSDDRGGGPGIAHLTARPGAAVVGEHFHPFMIEKFTVLEGTLDTRIAGRTMALKAGESVLVEPGVVHDWWNSSKTDEAYVLVEVDAAPGAAHIDPNRFEMLIGMLFGLANDGKVDRKGRPGLLQGAVIASEFADVIVFTNPPPAVQKIALGILAPLGRRLGYRAIDPRYVKPHGHVTPPAEILAAAGLSG